MILTIITGCIRFRYKAGEMMRGVERDRERERENDEQRRRKKERREEL